VLRGIRTLRNNGILNNDSDEEELPLRGSLSDSVRADEFEDGINTSVDRDRPNREERSREDLLQICNELSKSRFEPLRVTNVRGGHFMLDEEVNSTTVAKLAKVFMAADFNRQFSVASQITKRGRFFINQGFTAEGIISNDDEWISFENEIIFNHLLRMYPKEGSVNLTTMARMNGISATFHNNRDAKMTFRMSWKVCQKRNKKTGHFKQIW
jgi:hypothetical protein